MTNYTKRLINILGANSSDTSNLVSMSTTSFILQLSRPRGQNSTPYQCEFSIEVQSNTNDKNNDYFVSNSENILISTLATHSGNRKIGRGTVIQGSGSAFTAKNINIEQYLDSYPIYYDSSSDKSNSAKVSLMMYQGTKIESIIKLSLSKI